MALGGNIHFNLTGNSAKLSRALSLAQRDMNTTLRESQKLTNQLRAGHSTFLAVSQGALLMSSVMKTASIAAGGTAVALGSVALAAVHMNAEMETAATRVAAVSGGFEQYNEIVDRSFELGRKFGVSGKASAEAMNFLAMAGNNATDSMRLAEHSMMIATVGMIDAGRAADITTNIMTGMSLGMDDMDNVVDVLANTITGFNVNMTHMGDAFKYAAPLGSALDIGLSELSATLGLLGNAGLQGEQGGTIVRNMLLRLIGPTGAAAKAIKRWGVDLSEAAIKAGGIAHVIRELNRAGADQEGLKQVFGARAISGVLKLMDEGADRIEYFTRQVEKSGTAADINEQIMQTFERRFASFKTTISEHAYTLSGPWKNALTVAMTEATSFLGTIDNLDEKMTVFGQDTTVAAIEAMQEATVVMAYMVQGGALLVDGINLIINVLKVGGNAFVALGATVVGASSLIVKKALEIFQFFGMIIPALQPFWLAIEALAGFDESTAQLGKMAGQSANIATDYAKKMELAVGELGNEFGSTLDKSEAWVGGLGRLHGALGNLNDDIRESHKLMSMDPNDGSFTSHPDFSSPDQAPAKAGLNTGKGPGSKSKTGRKKKELDMLQEEINAMRVLNPMYAIQLEYEKEIRDLRNKKMSDTLKGLQIEAAWQKAEKKRQAIYDAEAKALKEIQDLAKEHAAGIIDGVEEAAEALVAEREEWIKNAAVIRETIKAYKKGVLERQQAQLLTLQSIDIEGQLQDILAEKQRVAQESFLTGEEAKAAAINRSNESIIRQIGALDGLTDSANSLANTQFNYQKALLDADTLEEKRLLGQKNQLDVMQQTAQMAPILAQAFGASAQQQLVAQTAVNTAMAAGALATGNLLGALGFGVSAVTGFLGIFGSSKLKATPDVPEINSPNANRERNNTQAAIVAALKEAGLYQRDLQSVTINQTGNDPVGFRNRTRTARNNNYLRLRATRDRQSR